MWYVFYKGRVSTHINSYPPSYEPFNRYEQQPGGAVRKEIYKQRGLMTSGHVRHPGANITPFAANMTRSVVDAAFPGQDVTKRVCA